MPNNNNSKPKPQPKANKPRPQRRRRNRKPKSTMQPTGTPRTPGTIIKTLGKKSPSKVNSPWVEQRLSALPTSSHCPIPDGRARSVICRCLYKVDRLTFTGLIPPTVQVSLAPFLPAPILVNGQACLLNGNTVPNAGRTYAGGGIAANWAINNTIGSLPGSALNSDYGKIRITSIGCRIRYTGPVTTCAGLIRVYPNPVTVLNTSETTATTVAPLTPIAGSYLGTYNSAGTLVNVGPIGSMATLVEGLSFQTPTSKVQCYRPEEGVIARCIHSGPYNYVDSATNTSALTFSPPQGNPVAYVNMYADQGTYGGAIIATDDSWTPVTISLENVNVDASYSIETCVCLEAQSKPTSPLYDLTTDYPVVDMAALNLAENVISKQGVSVPLSSGSMK